MRAFLVVAFTCGTVLAAHGEFADYRFIPPTKAKAANVTSAAVASSAVADLKRNAVPRYKIDDYAGKRAFLKENSTLPEMQVAVGAELAWTGADLFDKAVAEKDRFTWKAAIGSEDATALRFNVDLSALGPEDEVWVVDLEGPVSFGPYTFRDSEGEGRWMPTTMGDTAMLVVTSTRPDIPNVTVTKLSHFYEPIVDKGTDCPISADCISDANLQEVSTGIGRMSVTDEDGNSALCSGALLNNALTDTLESIFLTADHCFQDYPADIRASGIEVLWDVRTNGCPGSEPSSSAIAQSPRSTGTSFLASSGSLDAMLIALGNVPVGSLGRAYLGWDSRTPRISDAAVGIHHPGGRALRECVGRVDDIGVDSNFGLSQTTIRWTEGITEGGSSGSPVMFNDGSFRVFGMLSNGNFQSCSNNSARLDQYSSFQSFFTASAPFLNSDAPSLTGSPIYTSTGGGGGGGLACVLSERTLEESTGDIALAGLSIIVLLGLRNVQRRDA